MPKPLKDSDSKHPGRGIDELRREVAAELFVLMVMEDRPLNVTDEDVAKSAVMMADHLVKALAAPRPAS